MSVCPRRLTARACEVVSRQSEIGILQVYADPELVTMPGYDSFRRQLLAWLRYLTR